jgi:hypothetical protein
MIHTDHEAHHLSISDDSFKTAIAQHSYLPELSVTRQNTCFRSSSNLCTNFDCFFCVDPVVSDPFNSNSYQRGEPKTNPNLMVGSYVPVVVFAHDQFVELCSMSRRKAMAKKCVGLFVVLMLAGIGFSSADDCKYEAPHEATVSVEGATRISIDAGAGFLHVTGKPGLDEVRVTATACSEKESLLDDIKLLTGRRGNTIEVESSFPKMRWNSVAMRLDMTIEVPASFSVNIDDGSGEIVVSGVGDVDVDDGSGSISVQDCGAVVIDDGSGTIKVVHASGDVEVEDGSGNIILEQIGGDAYVRNDGSGNIDFRSISGSARVGSDGSGSIRAEHVGGDFIVRSDGSGSIRHSNVSGRVDVPRD